MAFFSALGNFLKRPEDDYGFNQTVQQSKSGGIGPMQMPQVSPPIPSEPVPSHVPRTDQRIGPENNPQTKLELMTNPVSGDVDVSNMNPIMNAFMNQELRKPTAMFDAPAFGTLDDVAARMGKPAGSFASELKKITDQWGSHYKLRIKDATRNSYIDPGEPAVAGYIELSPRTIEGHLPVSMTYLADEYRDKGLGSEMYAEAVKRAKEAGFRGLASDPSMRNQFSNEVWDRPGIGKTSTSYGDYDLMSEFLSRGRDWKTSPLGNLFRQDKAEQPMLPEVKDYLLEQMRNRSSSTPSSATNPAQSQVSDVMGNYQLPLFDFRPYTEYRRKY
jgi:GNAT superfamily N-acetyltransferase